MSSYLLSYPVAKNTGNSLTDPADASTYISLIRPLSHLLREPLSNLYLNAAAGRIGSNDQPLQAKEDQGLVASLHQD
jgi:hypothetical protein